MQPPSLIASIEQARTTLRRSERKVADYVLAHAEEVIHLRIVDLARAAGVSEPTVVRFCRAIGCNGFQGFKLALAQHVAHAPSYAPFSLTEQDSARDYSSKVFDATIGTLRQVRDQLDARVIEQAVAALASARRVEFYGFGASSAVAMDAQHKFFRLQIPSAAYADPHLQTMSAMSLDQDDVVVAISQSGRTQALLDAMQLVQEAGARVIGLAPGQTPVATECDLAIHIDAREESAHYAPLPSRIAHMAVIDVLAVGVSRAKGPVVNAHLQKLERGLQTLRTGHRRGK